VATDNSIPDETDITAQALDVTPQQFMCSNCPHRDKIMILILVIPYEVMKTITLKADARFDAMLTRLARQLKTTKSGVIRAAVTNYREHIEREALRQRIRDASAKTRRQAKQAASDLEAASADGI
jgi:predicted transcriptional regulator